MYHLVTSTLEEWSTQYAGPKFHAVLCDPPYDLNFMGKAWDRNADFKAWGEALLPHLLPGAIVLMFGGTRTWHHLACGMEEAGFQMWDTLMWLYGQGFPKGQDISKLIDKKNGDAREVVGRKAGERYKYTFSSDFNPEQPNSRLGSGDAGALTAPGSDLSAPWSGHKTCALKPAWEPILAFRVPFKGTYGDMATMFGSGALNIDGARISLNGETPPSGSAKRVFKANAFTEEKVYGDNTTTSPLGRYPANLLLECTCIRTESVQVRPSGSTKGTEPSFTGDANTVAYGKYGRIPFNAYSGEATGHTDPDCPAAQLDGQSGQSTTKRIEKPSDCGGHTWPGTFQLNRGARGHSDSGGASRFFYCAKASPSERNAGLTDVKNTHPTVKPLALLEYLATLLLPPDSVSPRRLLVPFAGSGSEMVAACNAGWDEVVGIEREAEYYPIAIARLEHHATN